MQKRKHLPLTFQKHERKEKGGNITQNISPKKRKQTEQLWTTHTDGSITAAWPQNSRYLADGKYISLALYRVAVSHPHERQNAYGISVCRRLTPVSSAKKNVIHHQSVLTHTGRKRKVAVAKTQGCRCENARLPLRKRKVAVAKTQGCVESYLKFYLLLLNKLSFSDTTVIEGGRERKHSWDLSLLFWETRYSN